MIRTFIIGIGMFAFALVPAMTLPTSVGAQQLEKFGDNASKGLKCSSSFLGFPTWFDGLPRTPGTCDIGLSENAKKNEVESFIFTIVLNVIEIALRLIGFAAVGFIIYGGFKYLTSAGSADRIASGRKIIQNALIGLVISFFSVAIVNLVARNI